MLSFTSIMTSWTLEPFPPLDLRLIILSLKKEPAMSTQMKQLIKVNLFD